MEFCTLGSSSSGNCSLVTCGNTYILIDAGISMRRIKTGLSKLGIAPENLAAILVTHEHSDHICGIKMMTKYFNTPIFAPELVGRAVCAVVPESEEKMTLFEAGVTFEINGIAVKSFRTPHDTPESVGYRLEAGGKSLAFVTDLGYVTRGIFDMVSGADAAVLESNHDIEMLKKGEYPYYLKQRILSKRGHLSNFDCGRFAGALAETGTRQIVLAHLSQKNNTPKLAYDTVYEKLAAKGPDIEREVGLAVAPACDVSKLYMV